MSKIMKLLVPAVLAMTMSSAGTSSASPTTGTAVWSWSNLYVRSYTTFNTGDFGAVFENAAGTQFTAWNDQNGVNQCPGQPTLRLAAGYAPAPEIAKLLLAAALAHKPLHVWFEATNGVCWIKQITASM